MQARRVSHSFASAGLDRNRSAAAIGVEAWRALYGSCGAALVQYVRCGPRADSCRFSPDKYKSSTLGCDLWLESPPPLERRVIPLIHAAHSMGSFVTATKLHTM